MGKRKVILSLAIVLGIGFFFGFLSGQSVVLNRKADTNAHADSEERVFSLMIDFGDGRIQTFHDIPFEPQEKLFSVLERTLATENINFAYEDYKNVGKLISEIGDRKNGAENKYWQYWVNNQSPEIGADQYPLESGDVIEWKFIAFKGL